MIRSTAEQLQFGVDVRFLNKGVCPEGSFALAGQNGMSSKLDPS